MTRYEPSTLIARWNSPNPQTTLPNLARSLSTNLSATSTGRFLVSIRTLRLPPPPPPTGKGRQKQSKVEGRNMYIVRKLEGNGEETAIIVEDPNKPHRPINNKGKGKATNQDDQGDGDMMIQGDTGEGASHYRWSYSTVSAPQATNSSSASSSSSTAIDSFIGRVLVAPPAPTSASTPQTQQAWQARPTALSLEGATFSISSNPISNPNNTDWLVKVAVVNVKGGTASGTTRGCIVQATYLPLPYLPPSSPLIRDFLLALFPSQAVQNGEITMFDPKEDEFVKAGILDPIGDGAEDGMQEVEGEWEWKEKHSLFSYIQQFRKEGLL